MSDGITDGYRAAREFDVKIKKLRSRLKEQKIEMLYYKAMKIHELASNLWTGYQSSNGSLYQKMFVDGQDLQKLFTDYLNEIELIVNLPNDMPAGQEMKWYSDMCWPKQKKYSL